MEDILGWETPDFVVFTGDLVTGDLMIRNVSEYIHMILRPVVEKRYRLAKDSNYVNANDKLILLYYPHKEGFSFSV